MPRSPAEALEPARAPEPPSRKARRSMHPVFTFLNRLISFTLISLLGAGALFYYAKYQFDKAGPLGHTTVVAIPKGDGVNTIAERLEREGIISDRLIFMLSVRYFNVHKKLKAGEYEIPKHASMRQVLDTIAEGKSILYKVTIPEGLTSQQIVSRLNNSPDLHGEITEIPPEGSLLPDTYKFTRGMSRMDLVERMLAEQRSFVDRLWRTRAEGLPYNTPEEAIVLASIVEKETSRADERRKIAGVFINRLKKNIRLQSDPTIIYGLVGGQGSLGRPLLKSEVDKKTPYNTYQIDGLPPTPIANPGRAAIEAVLNPEKTDAIYFVADGTGGHFFSSTLKEHQRNVLKWRKLEKELRTKREAEALAAAIAARKAGRNPITEVTGRASDEPSPADLTFPGLSIDGLPDENRTDGSAGHAQQGKGPDSAALDPANSSTGTQPITYIDGELVPIPERRPSSR